jgi:hypothetical protein
MKRPLLPVISLTLLAAGACGGGSPGEPLVSTTLVGHFKGQSFTPTSGVATVYQGSNLIAVGDGAITCASAQQNDPPMGTSAAFSLPALDLDTFSSVFVEMTRYEARNFDGFGSSDGTVMLTAVNAESVAGTIDYAFTDTTTGDIYDLSGAFEVSRCPM